jgi:hypothetical protein
MPKTFIKTRSVSLDEDEYAALIALVNNAWRMADEYREGREPGSDAEQMALIYQLTIERLQASLLDSR